MCVQEPCVYLLSAASVVIRNKYNRIVGSQADRQTGRQTGRKNRQTDRQTERQTDRQAVGKASRMYIICTVKKAV